MSSAHWRPAAAVATFATALFAPCPALAVVANGPDDICAPAADPCVVDQKYDVEAPGGVLDFGLRAVVMVPPGELRKSSTVLCGSFSATAATNAVSVNTNEGGGVAGSFTVRARRACSGDGTTPCMRNSACSALGLGTCSTGPAGTITIAGKLESKGADGGYVRLEAAGDLTVNEVVNVAANAIGGEGGFIDLESFMGSVTTTEKLNGSAGVADQYNMEPSSAGGLRITASDGDVSVSGRVEFDGGQTACGVDMYAYGALVLSNSISCDAGNLASSYGGYVRLYAEGSVSITGTANKETRISTTGGSQFSYGYYYQYPGGGGSQYFGSHAQFYVDEHSVLEAHTSFGGVPSCVDAYAGYIVGFHYNGSVNFNGRVEAEGRSRCGRGARVRFDSDYYAQGITFGPKSQIDIPGKVGGSLYFYSSGPHTLDGLINLRGRPESGAGEYAYSGIGGSMHASYGLIDLNIGGTIQSGSDGGLYAPLTFDACRINMSDTAEINLKHGEKWNPGFFPEGVQFSVVESMYVAPGARIVTAKNEAGQQGKIEVEYSTHKPPVLLGDIDPDALLSGNLPDDYCAVCGNDEVDFGESCDDGNQTAGDGCNDECQDEACIAATPGYPGVTLCDDGDACTVDACVASACVHVLSCEEGVSCTVDVCALGACEHTADDGLCDDANECTVDVCNATTGCAHTDLSGSACDDGDFCTVTDICAGGDCVAADSRFATDTRVKVKIKDSIGDDRMKIKSTLPSDLFTADPTVTGLEVETRGAGDQTVHNGVLPAAGWEDKRGQGTKFRFRDKDGVYPSANGFNSASIKVQANKNRAKINLKTKGVDVPGALDQTRMSVSLLFGTDPAADVCLTGARVPCKVKPTLTNCKE